MQLYWHFQWEARPVKIICSGCHIMQFLTRKGSKLLLLVSNPTYYCQIPDSTHATFLLDCRLPFVLSPKSSWECLWESLAKQRTGYRLSFDHISCKILFYIKGTSRDQFRLVFHRPMTPWNIVADWKLSWWRSYTASLLHGEKLTISLNLTRRQRNTSALYHSSSSCWVKG